MNDQKQPPTPEATTAPAPTQETPALPKVKAPVRTLVKLRRNLPSDELRLLGSTLANTFSELRSAEDEKKAVVTQCKAKIDAIKARATEIAGKVSSGFEMTDIQCEIRYDQPSPGMKSTVRLDTGEVINVDPMTDAERQTELPLKVEEKKPVNVGVGGVVVVAADKDGTIDPPEPDEEAGEAEDDIDTPAAADEKKVDY